MHKSQEASQSTENWNCKKKFKNLESWYLTHVLVIFHDHKGKKVYFLVLKWKTSKLPCYLKTTQIKHMVKTCPFCKWLCLPAFLMINKWQSTNAGATSVISSFYFRPSRALSVPASLFHQSVSVPSLSPATICAAQLAPSPRYHKHDLEVCVLARVCGRMEIDSL